MKKFFKVKTIDEVLLLNKLFQKVEEELITIEASLGRILAEKIYSDIDIPSFKRSTMDGFAIKASSSFGSSELNPSYFDIKGKVKMGLLPSFSIHDGEAAEISTGGALPNGSDSVIMLEHTSKLDGSSIEIYKSLAPGSNVIDRGEDVKKNDISLNMGTKIRPQEIGIIAASGRNKVKVFKKPIVGLISTGNEIIPIDERPDQGEIRDINSYTLSGQVIKSGGIPRCYGIIPDQFDLLKKVCSLAVKNSDIVIISGGSSLGARDLTVDIFESIKNTEILVHGISISPGKPTILAKSGNKQLWGLPGHAASAMVVLEIIVKKFIEKISGFHSSDKTIPLPTAILTRNISSPQGRVDYVRVRFVEKKGKLFVEPIIGKSGLISTIVKADGLLKIDINSEGLYKDTNVPIILL